MKNHIVLLFYMYLVFLGETSSVSRADYGEVKLFQTPVSYNVEMTVLLNDVSRRDKEVSFKVKAALTVDPVWSGSEHEHLLKFEVGITFRRCILRLFMIFIYNLYYIRETGKSEVNLLERNHVQI